MPPKKQGRKTASSSAKKARSKSKVESYYPSYVRLRTMLDSLELLSLRFYLEVSDPVERQKRQEWLSELMMPIVKELESVQEGITADLCPEGYVECMGVCVPYPCPNGEMAS
jgi:hypothetical protein